jgi:predicted O-methyltransferase YrrM
LIGVGRGDMFFFDYVVAKHNQFKEFIELGTFGGVTSLYLGMMAKLRNANFYTFDISDRRIECIKNNWLDNMLFMKEDVLISANEKVIKEIEKDSVLLFIDNGNKIKEFNLYVQYLKVNSVVIVHDWNEEIREKDVIEEIKKYNLIPFHNNIAEDLQSSCRGWIKQ